MVSIASIAERASAKPASREILSRVASSAHASQIGEQRDAVGVDEDLEADALVDAPRRQLAHEREVLAAYRRALGERSREHLRGRRRAGAKVVDQLRRGVPVAGDLVDDPSGDRLADLGIPAGERLTYAAHRASVIAV